MFSCMSLILRHIFILSLLQNILLLSSATINIQFKRIKAQHNKLNTMQKQEKQRKKQETKVMEKDTLLAKLFVFAKQKNET